MEKFVPNASKNYHSMISTVNHSNVKHIFDFKESSVSVNSLEKENSQLLLKETELQFNPLKKSFMDHNEEREKYLFSILEYIPVL